MKNSNISIEIIVEAESILKSFHKGEGKYYFGSKFYNMSDSKRMDCIIDDLVNEG